MVCAVQIRTYLRRPAKYSAVGVLGTGVKLGALVLCHGVCGLGCLASTALAVECSMIHNFAWHMSWTWRDRSPSTSGREIAARLLRFQLGNGGVALLINLVSMPVLTGGAGFNYPLAGTIVSLLGAIINYALSNRWVFTRPDAAEPCSTP